MLNNSKPVAMYKVYNRNSSGQLTQTCPALAIKTATIPELVEEEKSRKVEKSYKSRKIKIVSRSQRRIKAKMQTSSCIERVARTHPNKHINGKFKIRCFGRQ